MKHRLFSHILPQDAEIACRHCGSTDVRPSHKAAHGMGHVVYRCRSCKQHFKVASGRSRLPMMLGVSVFLLAVGVTAVGFMARTDPSADDPPQATTRDAQALARLRNLASQGDTQAQYDLGRSYWHQDEFSQALPWLKAAADRGHAQAQYLLGQAYQYGRGTVQNYRAAQEQFAKAAEQGHLEAEYELGIFQRDGLAGPPNKEAAYVWLNLAAAQGHADALILRDKLTMAMTGEEILRAQEASSAALKRLERPVARSTRP